jgi:hypothetical protein
MVKVAVSIFVLGSHSPSTDGIEIPEKDCNLPPKYNFLSSKNKWKSGYRSHSLVGFPSNNFPSIPPITAQRGRGHWWNPRKVIVRKTYKAIGPVSRPSIVRLQSPDTHHNKAISILSRIRSTSTPLSRSTFPFVLGWYEVVLR